MPALFDLNEPVVTGLRDRLEIDLATTIDQLNALPASPVQIDRPAAVLDYVPTLSELVEFPTVGIQDAPTRFTEDIGSSATGNHELTVIAFLADPEMRTLAWQCRRYTRALTSVILAARSLPGAAWGLTLGRIDPGPTLQDPENPRSYMSWTAVTVNARTDESA